MHNNFLFKILFFLASSFLFLSCDKDFNEIGSDLIGNNNFELKDTIFSVFAYNEKITPIQSENLPINALGIYNNPAFGKTTANFVTQVNLANLNPKIGNNTVIDSVYIDVPYFSTKLTTDTTMGSTYKLDSIYGEPNSKIKLSIYESGIDMDKDGDEGKKVFYSNQNDVFDEKKKVFYGRLNNDPDKSQNDEFFFNHKEKITVTKDANNKKITTYSAPGMHLKLNTVFFQDKIFKAPTGTLSDQIVFHKHFNGLYFKVEQSGTDKGSLAMINFKKGTITIKYKEDSSTTPITRVEKSLVLNLTGNTVSLLEDSNPNTDYDAAIKNPDRDFGDPKLYLKGGEGSMAVIDLFNKEDLIGYDKVGNLTGPNEVSDELDKIRKEGWLINQADLVFNIDADNTEFKKSFEPQRIYLFDLNNRRPIIDYFLDGTLGTTTKNGKVIFGGNINLDPTSKRGVNYKINITNHIRNLIKYSDSTNVKMGVVVTESIAIIDSNIWRTPTTIPTTAIPQIPYYTLEPPKLLKYRNIETPKASVMNPLGTILYGSNASDEKKRLKLKIYYTKPK